jgi:hypothetical protein
MIVVRIDSSRDIVGWRGSWSGDGRRGLWDNGGRLGGGWSWGGEKLILRC